MKLWAKLAQTDFRIDPRDTPIPMVEFGGVAVKIINILLISAGLIAVLMIIISGYRYVMFGSNPSDVKKAKDTILWALVGLAITTFAMLIVNFVIGRIKG